MLTQNRNNIMDTIRHQLRSLLTPPSTSKPIALSSLIIFVAFVSSFTTYYTTHPTIPYPGAGGPYTISDLRVQPHVLTYNDDVLVQRFLNSHPGNVTKAAMPAFIPRLSSQCFWEKTDVKFYKRGITSPRLGHTLRCLPSVYIVGFSKSGTSDLHSQLTQHQHVFASFYKEAHFWNRSPILSHKMTIRDYIDLYSQGTSLIESCCLSQDLSYGQHKQCGVNRKVASSLKQKLGRRKTDNLHRRKKKLVSHMRESVDMNGHAATLNSTHCPLVFVDGTPRYIWDGQDWKSDPNNLGLEKPRILTANKIHHVQPNAKIIILMRRPEDRLWSDYNFFKESHKTASDFHTKVVQGIDWWHRCREELSVENCAIGNDYDHVESPRTDKVWVSEGSDRVRIGIYYAFIKRWLELFPRRNILFIKFEDYIQDPIQYMSDVVFPFLGLSDASLISKHNMQDNIAHGPRLSNKKSHKQSMLLETRHILNSFYKPFNEELATLIQDDRFLWKD